MAFMWKRFKRLLVLAVMAIGAFLIFAPGYVEKSRNTVAEHARFDIAPATQKFHDSLMVGDLHADSLLWKRDLLKRGTRGHVDVPRLLEGNVTLQVFTAVTKSPSGQNYNHNHADADDNITLLAIGQLWPPRTWNSLLERALYQAEKLHGFAEKSQGTLRVITTGAELEQLLADKNAGQAVVGGLLGIEGAHPLEGEIANLDRLEAAGYRLIALQHFFDNKLGGSLHGFSDQGLTDFGRQVVTQVQERGLILDIAHSAPAVARDVIAMIDMPFVVSHTGIHGHCAVKRNYPDQLMREIAAAGGILGIGYWETAACDISPAGVAQSIKSAVDLVGVDHVALGSDFDGSVGTGFDTSELAIITQELLALGYSEADIRKIMGENMLALIAQRLAARP